MVNITKKIIYILIILGYILSLIFNIYKYEYKYNSDNETKRYKVMVIEKQKQDENKISYLVKLKNDKFLLNIYIKSKYDNNKNFTKEKLETVQAYKYGDYININGKITIPENLGNIGEFNYKKYLNSKDICGIINSQEVEYVDNIGNKCVKWIYTLKQNISKSIDDNLEDKEAELLKSMVYGDTRNLDEDIKEGFNNIGISHITAVSGSNLNILLLILSAVLYKIRNKCKIYLFIQILIIFLFCIISGLELSIIRASIMSIIVIICNHINIKMSANKILISTLYIITIINPFRIFNIGMIFSFLAIIGLSCFCGKIYNFFESKINWNIQNIKISKILCNISKVVAVTISVNILVLPISIYVFNQFSLMFIFSNLIISVFASLINILGIIAIIITKIPTISDIIYWTLNLLLKVIIYLSELLNSINICINIKSFPLIIIIIYYIYILVICIKIKSNKKYIKLKLDSIKRKVLICLIITIIINYIYNIFFNNYIYFLNVGQGEMAIIKNKENILMIDSGSITNSSPYIFEAYMQKENIQKINALVISHFHSDHINGIKDILKICDIEYIIYAYPYDMQTSEYINLIKEVDANNIKHIQVQAGDNLNIDGINLNILFPIDNYIYMGDDIDKNENANSLVFNVNINNKNYLFMGDATKESEEYVLKELGKQNINNIEVVKIGHHGSKTSTSELFIKSILPKFAVISSKKKVYNHPSDEVINLLNKYNVLTYITEKVGGIKYII